MAQPEQFDVLVLGSGTGREADRLAYGGIRSADRRRRAALGRGSLSPRRLHAEQERDLKRGVAHLARHAANTAR